MEDCRERWRCSESEDKRPAVDSVKKYVQRETDVRKPARGQRDGAERWPLNRSLRIRKKRGSLFKVMNI